MPLPRPARQQQIDALRLVLAMDDALLLAIEERTGAPAQPGDAYTAEDYERAKQILETCFKQGVE